MTAHLAERYPVKLICQLLNYARSLYYYAPKLRDESAAKAAIGAASSAY